jgi:hypothetical protein
MSLELLELKHPGWIANKILWTIVRKSYFQSAHISHQSGIHLKIVEEVLEEVISSKPELFAEVDGVGASKFGVASREGGREALILFLSQGAYRN